MPTAQQVASAYPQRARRERVEGQGVVTCTVNAQGGLDNCSVTRETPGGYGFGQATLGLMRNFRMRLPGPVAVGGQVALPLSYRLPEGEHPTPAAPEGTLVSPTWAAEATRTQVDAAYPVGSSPQATRVHGWVVLDCTTNDQGVAGNCAVAAEDPPGRGFGAAAQGLAGNFRLAPTQAGGAAIAGAKVRLIIGW